MIVLMAGLPGTGKSTLARELSRLTHGIVLSKDEIRAAIFSPQHIDYSVDQDDFVMGIMLHASRFLLQRSASGSSASGSSSSGSSASVIFLDGRTFSRAYQIDRALAFATEMRQPWRILECACSEESARRRLEHADPSHPARNRSFDLYLEMKAGFEKITLPKTVIDTDQQFEHCVGQALSALSLP
jgi:adenylylsulfate kinase